MSCASNCTTAAIPECPGAIPLRSPSWPSAWPCDGARRRHGRVRLQRPLHHPAAARRRPQRAHPHRQPSTARPTVVFGHADILITNTAWILRRLPLFVVPASGGYRLQPVYVEDLARLGVEAGGHRDVVVFDAVGPETYTFDELVLLVRAA